MSIQLVLSHYLAGLRERNELDALLPELLRAMGHSVLSLPQVGVAQAGVDVVSTHENDYGELEVFLFVIKFGDVGRDDFYGGKQAIDPSIREACNDFIRNRLPESLRSKSKKVILVSNGVLKQEVQAGFAALSHDVAERPLCALDFWGTYQLTPLIEQYLFDEALLLSKGKSELRAALASLEESGFAIQRFIRFVESCLAGSEDESAQNEAIRKKRFLKRCATASMGWAVLLVWGQSEENLKPGVVAGEYLVLRLWAEAVKAGLHADKEFAERLGSLVTLQIKALLEYFERVMPQLINRRAVLMYRPEHFLYSELIFEELGRFAILLLLLQGVPGQANARAQVRLALICLLNEHTGCRLPLYDDQSIDLTLVLTALIGELGGADVKDILSDVIGRLHHALRTSQYLPIDTDLLEDAVALNVNHEVEPREFFKTSSLVPALATISALLHDDESLKRLCEEVQPLLADVTLERWFPVASLETLTGSQLDVQDVGISRALAGIRDTALEEINASLKTYPGVASPEDFKWHGTPWVVFAAISARIHRHPVPTWFISQYAKSASK